MTKEELRDLLKSRESDVLEFKTDPNPETMARAVAAFLNHLGGRLVLGVGPEGQVLGLRDADAALARLHHEVPKMISPSAPWAGEKVEIEGKNILVVEVPMGTDQPYVVGGAIYLRRGERIVPANRDEMSHIIEARAKQGFRWERQVVMGIGFNELDHSLILETMRLASEAGRWSGGTTDVEDFLVAMGLSESGAFTHAALLLYGNRPTRLVPQAGVRLLVSNEGKDAKTGTKFPFDRWFEGNLIKMATEVPAALASLVGGVESTFSEESWQRKDRARYPGYALREGVMNALIHRDYLSTASVLIQVSTNSIQITNPGKLVSPLTVPDLKKEHLSTPRNPDLAHLCFLHGLIEKIGRGTQNILRVCRENRLRDPKWVSEGASTSLTLYAPAVIDVSVVLNERQNKILELLASGERLRVTQLAAKVDPSVSTRTIRSDLLQLVHSGRLVQRGRGRNTSYQVSSNAS